MLVQRMQVVSLCRHYIIVSPNDGPPDAVSRKIDHIALPTEYNYQTKSIGQQQIATLTEKCRLLTHLNDNGQTPLG